VKRDRKKRRRRVGEEKGGENKNSYSPLHVKTVNLSVRCGAYMNEGIVVRMCMRNESVESMVAKMVQ